MVSWFLLVNTADTVKSETFARRSSSLSMSLAAIRRFTMTLPSSYGRTAPAALSLLHIYLYPKDEPAYGSLMDTHIIEYKVLMFLVAHIFAAGNVSFPENHVIKCPLA